MTLHTEGLLLREYEAAVKCQMSPVFRRVRVRPREPLKPQAHGDGGAAPLRAPGGSRRDTPPGSAWCRTLRVTASVTEPETVCRRPSAAHGRPAGKSFVSRNPRPPLVLENRRAARKARQAQAEPSRRQQGVPCAGNPATGVRR